MKRSRSGRSRGQTVLRTGGLDQDQREWLRVTLSSIGDAVIATDTVGRVAFINPVAEKLTGWPQEEAMGRPCDEVFRIVNEATRRPVESPVERVLREGTVVGLANHTVLIARSGDEVPVDDSGAPIRDEGGRLLGVVLVFRDISERRRVERERAEWLGLERWHRHAAELVSAVARSINASLDLDTVLQRVVEGAKELCGSDLAAILLREPGGEAVVPRYRAGSRSSRYDALRIEPGRGVGGQVLLTGRSFRTDDYLGDARIGADYRWLAEQEGIRALLVVPIRIGDRVEGLIYVDNRTSRPFTERDERVLERLADHAAVALRNAQLFAAEQAARADAEMANRAKDEFLATVSHELRTPLTAILGWTRLLRTGTLDAVGAARALETVERNAQLQVQLIEDLLDVSRIIAGKLRLDVQTVDLAVVVRAAVDALGPAATAKDIAVAIDVEPAARMAVGDPDRLQQVAWNLLSNAIKFTPPGGRIEVRVARRDTRVAITTTDTGSGIPPDLLPYVFDRFRQGGDGAGRARGGLGLGLAIVRHLVELHGGTVRAASPGVGQGATFTVELPVRAVTVPDPEAPERGIGTLPALDGVRVLVVDDEPDARSLLATVLEGCGAAVTCAAGVAEGLEAFDRLRPHVIVSDIGMPGEDGYTLIRRVRERAPEEGGRVPAVALTAYARAEDRRRALMAGFSTHLPKPVEPAELAVVVGNLAVPDGRR